MPSSSSASPTITRVLRGELCTGCGLCAALANGAVEMQSSAPGYSRPVVNGAISTETEAAIAATCPGTRVEPWTGIAENVDPYWGPWREVMVGAATDPVTRFEGSSGGAISAFLTHALRSGQVDRVVHIAADPQAPTRNLVVVSRSPDDVVQRAGSRYTASSPLVEIDEMLDEGGSIAFVGKPCDVSALRQLARIDPRVDRHVRLMLSFFCAGIPSHDGVYRILREMRVEPGAVAAFRYRGQGWPGYCVAEEAGGRKVEMTYARSWGDHLSKEVQFRCKICPDAVGGAADVACADAWYGDEAGYPAFDEADGRSLIIARTAVGRELVHNAIAGGAVEGHPLPLAEIEKMQPGQARRKRLVLARTASLPFALQPAPDMRGLEVARAARLAPFREALQNFLGTLRRTLQGRRSRL